MSPSQPPALPLLFSFSQVVVGNGFVAVVEMQGRALLEVETDGSGETWITGIAPVGIAAGGTDRTEAFVKFRRAFVEILFDLVDEARSFTEFDVACRSFLSSAQDNMTRLWLDAVDMIRRDGYSDPSLHKGDANEPSAYKVTCIKQLTSAANATDKTPELAA